MGAFPMLNSIVDDISLTIDKIDVNKLNEVSPVLKKSVPQIVYHLSYFENIYVSAMFRKLRYGYKPQIDSFADFDCSDMYFDSDEIAYWMKCLKEERECNCRYLKDNYEFMQLNCLEHKVHGELKLEDILQTIRKHDIHHMEEILQIISEKNRRDI